MVTTFRVPDMTCGHCASTIAKAIRAEDSAARLEFDIGEHLVCISSAAMPKADLQEALRAAGYNPMEVQPRAAQSARTSGGGCGCRSSTAQRFDMPQSAASAKGGCCS
jgi:copper chaperone